MIALTILLATTIGVANVQADSAVSCKQELDSLAGKIRSDYAGFVLEHSSPAARARLDDKIRALRSRAEGAIGDKCFYVLRDLTDYFADPHLAILQSSEIDSAETRRRAATVEITRIGEGSARAYYAANAAHLDPIEGIWYDKHLRIAVVPDSAAGKGKFIAVVVTPDTSIWPVGSLRAHLVRRTDGAYETSLSLRTFALHRGRGRIYRRDVLRIDPYMFGKELPLAEDDARYLDRNDVRRPTLVFIHHDSTPVVSVPSHDPEYRGALDTLVADGAAKLAAASALIIDFRGNQGGSFGTTRALAPYYASRDWRARSGSDDIPVMLASVDQMKYVGQTRAGYALRDSLSVENLLARMRANIGKLVPITETGSPYSESKFDSVVAGNRRVGIIVDRGTVSASEAVALHARHSSRVTIFGERTEGATFYTSVNAVRIIHAERRWFLGYPTVAGSAAVPSGGTRSGVAPDVILTPTDAKDVIERVRAALARR